MNTRTGQITELQPGESLAAMAKRTGQLEADLVELGRQPARSCSKCKGRGVIKRGFFSRRYKPCPCTWDNRAPVTNPIFR